MKAELIECIGYDRMHTIYRWRITLRTAVIVSEGYFMTQEAALKSLRKHCFRFFGHAPKRIHETTSLNLEVLV